MKNSRDKKNLLFGLISIGIMLTACSTTYIVGNNFNESYVEEIKLGKTDSTQIIRMFGEPFKRGRINQFNVFIYSYEENKFPPSNSTQIKIDRNYKTLYVVFDDQGLVNYYTQNVPMTFGSLDLMIRNEKKKQEQQENNNYINDQNYR